MPRGRPAAKAANGRRLVTQGSVNSAIKSICDVMRRSNCAGALQYVPELTWLLFLRILDERETREAEEAEAVGAEFTPSLESPYRWQDWAAPGGAKRDGAAERRARRVLRLRQRRAAAATCAACASGPTPRPRQKVISEILSGVERVRIDTERNLLDVLDKVHEITRRGHRPDARLSRSRRSTRGCSSRWARRATTAASSSPRARSSAPWCEAIDPKPGETVYDPVLRNGRLPHRGVQAHAGEARRRPPRRTQLDTLGQPLALRPREREPDLSHRAGQPRAARHRRAASVARQHAHRERDLRRAVPGRPRALSTSC